MGARARSSADVGIRGCLNRTSPQPMPCFSACTSNETKSHATRLGTALAARQPMDDHCEDDLLRGAVAGMCSGGLSGGPQLQHRDVPRQIPLGLQPTPLTWAGCCSHACVPVPYTPLLLAPAGCYDDLLVGTGLECACVEAPAGAHALLFMGDELFPGATSVKLLDADEVDSLGPIIPRCGAGTDTSGADLCSRALRPHSLTTYQQAAHAASPGTPDSMQSNISAQSHAGSHVPCVPISQPWQGLSTAASCPELAHAGFAPALGAAAATATTWVEFPSPSSSNPPLARSATSSMASLVSLLPSTTEQDGTGANVPLPRLSLDAGALHAKRTIVRPKRMAAFVPAAPPSPKGRKRGGPGGQPCKVAPNPDGRTCTACGTQVSRVSIGNGGGVLVGEGAVVDAWPDAQRLLFVSPCLPWQSSGGVPTWVPLCSLYCCVGCPAALLAPPFLFWGLSCPCP